MRRLRPRLGGRATRRRHVALATSLWLFGVALAVLVLVAVIRNDPSAGSSGLPAFPPAPAVARTASVLVEGSTLPRWGTPPSSGPMAVATAPESRAGQGEVRPGGSQAFGWLYHRDYPADPIGAQIAFAIARDGDGQAAIEAFGMIWNRPAGLDLQFEMPAGLAAPLTLGPETLSETGLSRLETKRLPAVFKDRTGSTQSGSYPGTVAFVIEGAGDVYGFTPLAREFSPESEEWNAKYRAEFVNEWRLAQASISLDCPDLGLCELLVSDWESDFVELFDGSPLRMEVKGWGWAGMLYSIFR